MTLPSGPHECRTNPYFYTVVEVRCGEAATTLDDAILVLLSAHPSTAYELQRRHADMLGDAHRVDVLRFLSAITRLERSGHVRLAAPAPQGRRNRPVCTLTDAGRLR